MNQKAVISSLLLMFAMSIGLNAAGDKKVSAKSATASSAQSENMPEGVKELEAKYAIDGNRETRWSSKWEDNQWIEVDLGKRIAISKLMLYWETAHAASYKLEVSNNKKKWKDVHSNDNCTGGEETITLKQPEKARFLRLTCLKRATEWGFSLFEIEFFGK